MCGLRPRLFRHSDLIEVSDERIAGSKEIVKKATTRAAKSTSILFPGSNEEKSKFDKALASSFWSLGSHLALSAMPRK